MNISPVNFNSINPIKLNNNSNQNRCFSAVSNDVFVRNSNVNFKGVSKTSPDVYQELKQDVMEYVLLHDKLTAKEIQDVTSKYFPEIKVDDMENLPKNSNVAKNHVAYTYRFVQLAIGDDGQLEIIDNPQVVYLNLPQGNSLDEKAKIADNILHELTHVIQSRDSKKDTVTVLRKNLSSIHSQDRAIQTFVMLPQIFRECENAIAFAIAKYFSKEDDSPLQIDSNLKLNDVTSQIYGKTAKEIAELKLKEIFTNLGDKVDRKTVLAYFQTKAMIEAEAQQNGIEAKKEILGMQKQKIDSDLLIEMYNVMAKVAKKYK